MRRLAVAALAFGMLGASGAILWQLSLDRPALISSPIDVPWWALAVAYLLALRFPVTYEFRQNAQIVSLTQLPLAIGLVFVAPAAHLAARFTATLLDAVVIRRQPPLKTLVNTASGVIEVMTASLAVGLLSLGGLPRPTLWMAIFGALIVADLVGYLAISLVLNLAGARQGGRDLVTGLVTNAALTSVFAGLAIVSVAAVYTDPTTSVVIVFLVGGLMMAFRRHQQLAVEQQRSSALHQFVKALGPLDLAHPASTEVLDSVRVLLHAQFLDLALQDGDRWQHFTVGDASLYHEQDLPRAANRHAAVMGSDDHMSTPLLGAHELVGALTVRHRMGNIRAFNLRDLRLLETVAAELGTALERGLLQRELALAATTDPLTHLPNLNEVTRHIDHALASTDGGLLVATVAVDSFREVNDTLGHQVGDELVREVARRLTRSFPDAILGRIGGGRFVVAVGSQALGEDPSMFGLSIRTQVEGGAQLGPVGAHIRLSVGCVRTPEHGTDASTLIRRAETAMYSARHAHGGPVVWEPAYEVQGQRRLAVVMALREALSAGAIGVAFQPKVGATSGLVTGVEALARWTHPALGAISPQEFVPLAEAAGLMRPLTTTVLRQSLTACKGWQRRGGRVGVAVNVSADTVLDPSFVTEVAAILTSVNISADLLTLELTESVVVEDPALAAVRMRELRALGCKISVDDFGTGYSSLTYLRGLPVDEVKIDKGFVDGISHDEGDRAVVRAVVDIAHTLGLRVVAEGVEQEEQHHLLGRLGVDEVQGFLHARPMAALDMSQWLRRRDQTVQSIGK